MGLPTSPPHPVGSPDHRQLLTVNNQISSDRPTSRLPSQQRLELRRLVLADSHIPQCTWPLVKINQLVCQLATTHFLQSTAASTRHRVRQCSAVIMAVIQKRKKPNLVTSILARPVRTWRHLQITPKWGMMSVDRDMVWCRTRMRILADITLTNPANSPSAQDAYLASLGISSVPNNLPG